jgi:hypothetical protein
MTTNDISGTFPTSVSSGAAKFTQRSPERLREGRAAVRVRRSTRNTFQAFVDLLEDIV